MLKARRILSEAWGEEETNRYLDGELIFERHKLKDCIDQDKFNDCVARGKISPEVPTTNQIWKKCHDELKLTISKTKLSNIVDKIREKRNEVMHGVEISDDLEQVAFEAIENFEKFIEYFGK